MLIVTVDPGVSGCGVAWFDDQRLYAVEYRIEPLRVGTAERCICEKPVVYDRAVKGVRIPPDDLIRLAIAAGRMTGQLETEYVTPASWKGQVPKDVHHKRIRRHLTLIELIVLDSAHCPKYLRHNLIDAVGIGLKHLGRM